MKTKILLIGSGAVGSYYAALLSKAGAEVNVICRSDYKEARDNGIYIKSYLGDIYFSPNLVLNKIEDYQDCVDFIIFATKSLPSIDVAKTIKPILEFGHNKSKSSLVLIQNGIHIEEQIKKDLPNIHLISSIAFIAASKVGPATINHQYFGKIIIGDYPPNSYQSIFNDKTKLLANLFKESNTECYIADDIRLERWKKLVWNIGFNPASVIFGGKNTKELLQNDVSRNIIKSAMQEVKNLAEADGFKLPEDIIDENINKTYKMPPYKTSMLLDFENKREMEIEAIIGNAFRFAREKNISTPVIEDMYKKLLLISNS